MSSKDISSLQSLLRNAETGGLTLLTSGLVCVYV